MKTKTIQKVLHAKFHAFADSITDPVVKETVKQNGIITGGSIVSLLLNENVNDYDLYFRTHDAALAVATYYCRKFGESELGKGYEIEAKTTNGRVTISVNKSKNVSVAGDVDAATLNVPEAEDDTDIIETIEQADALEAAKLEGGKAPAKADRYQPLFLSSNAITLSTKVQLIIRFYGEPDQIHENYDFVHCTSYWTSWDNRLTLRQAALESILAKELRYVGSRYPICSIIRTRKFLARGWTINAGQYVKMAWQVSELNLKDIEVLKDQLVGVDSAYFNQLIWALSEKQRKDLEADANASAVIDGGYLITLIDKIF